MRLGRLAASGRLLRRSGWLCLLLDKRRWRLKAGGLAASGRLQQPGIGLRGGLLDGRSWRRINKIHRMGMWSWRPWRRLVAGLLPHAAVVPWQPSWRAEVEASETEHTSRLEVVAATSAVNRQRPMPMTMIAAAIRQRPAAFALEPNTVLADEGRLHSRRCPEGTQNTRASPRWSFSGVIGCNSCRTAPIHGRFPSCP